MVPRAEIIALEDSTNIEKYSRILTNIWKNIAKYCKISKNNTNIKKTSIVLSKIFQDIEKYFRII